MDKIFANIIYYLCQATFNYYKATFHYSKLFQLTLFTTIYDYTQFFCYFQLFQPQVIFGYFRLFHFRLFMAIVNYFILGYFLLCESIVGQFWLLKVISPYVIIGYSRLCYHRLFVPIILVAIDGYSIGGYQWLFY